MYLLLLALLGVSCLQAFDCHENPFESSQHEEHEEHEECPICCLENDWPQIQVAQKLFLDVHFEALDVPSEAIQTHNPDLALFRPPERGKPLFSWLFSLNRAHPVRGPSSLA